MLPGISLRHNPQVRFEDSKKTDGEGLVGLRCYLVRHGDAVSADLDPRRPLSARGRDQVAELARLALARKVYVAEICHSGILRAQQTAQILAAQLNPERGVRSIAGLLPDDDPENGKSELELADEPVMWVGHLPYMSRLAFALIQDNAAHSTIEFSPATMVCCTKFGAQWQIEWQMAPAPR